MRKLWRCGGGGAWVSRGLDCDGGGGAFVGLRGCLVVLLQRFRADPRSSPMEKLTVAVMTIMATLHSQLRLGEENPVELWTLWWWIYGGISMLLVCFAGIMSGLTLGLMSLGLMDLEVLQRSGTLLEKKQAGIRGSSPITL